MRTTGVVIEKPREIDLAPLRLIDPGPDDVVVDVSWTGVSTGTEKLLWTGEMPAFPGMGYPLVPGYEAVGRVVEAGANSGRQEGDLVFAPGSRAYRDVKGLFGASAARLIAPGVKTCVLPGAMGEDAVLLALAATAHHALMRPGARRPDLIVGHGVLGRLMARTAIALGWPAPVVWETAKARRSGADGYDAIDPASDERRDYAAVIDASGDPAILDAAIARLARGGEITLAGFYAAPLSFAFPPAFMREAVIRVAAEFTPDDVAAALALVARGDLSLAGLITHRAAPDAARGAYETAFGDAACLKMTIDWRECA